MIFCLVCGSTYLPGAEGWGEYPDPRSESFSFSAYCRCGSTLSGGGTWAEESVEKILGIFWTTHVGAGHGPTSSRTASRARKSLLPLLPSASDRSAD